MKHILSVESSIEKARTIKRLRANNDQLRAALEKFIATTEHFPAGIAPVGDPGMSVYLPDAEKYWAKVEKAIAAAAKAMERQ